MEANPDFWFALQALVSPHMAEIYLIEVRRRWPAFPKSYMMCVWCVCVCACRDTGDGQIRLDTVDAARPWLFVRRMWFSCEVGDGCGAALGSVMGEGTDWQWQWGGNGSEWGGMAPVRPLSQWQGRALLSKYTAKWILFYTCVFFFSLHRARNRGYL